MCFILSCHSMGISLSLAGVGAAWQMQSASCVPLSENEGSLDAALRVSGTLKEAYLLCFAIGVSFWMPIASIVIVQDFYRMQSRT
jgi:hypothetical protein